MPEKPLESEETPDRTPQVYNEAISENPPSPKDDGKISEAAMEPPIAADNEGESTDIAFKHPTIPGLIFKKEQAPSPTPRRRRVRSGRSRSKSHHTSEADDSGSEDISKAQDPEEHKESPSKPTRPSRKRKTKSQHALLQKSVSEPELDVKPPMKEKAEKEHFPEMDIEIPDELAYGDEISEYSQSRSVDIGYGSVSHTEALSRARSESPEISRGIDADAETDPPALSEAFSGSLKSKKKKKPKRPKHPQGEDEIEKALRDIEEMEKRKGLLRQGTSVESVPTLDDSELSLSMSHSESKQPAPCEPGEQITQRPERRSKKGRKRKGQQSMEGASESLLPAEDTLLPQEANEEKESSPQPVLVEHVDTLSETLLDMYEKLEKPVEPEQLPSPMSGDSNQEIAPEVITADPQAAPVAKKRNKKKDKLQGFRQKEGSSIEQEGDSYNIPMDTAVTAESDKGHSVATTGTENIALPTELQVETFEVEPGSGYQLSKSERLEEFPQGVISPVPPLMKEEVAEGLISQVTPTDRTEPSETPTEKQIDPCEPDATILVAPTPDLEVEERAPEGKAKPEPQQKPPKRAKRKGRKSESEANNGKLRDSPVTSSIDSPALTSSPKETPTPSEGKDQSLLPAQEQMQDGSNILLKSEDVPDTSTMKQADSLTPESTKILIAEKPLDKDDQQAAPLMSETAVTAATVVPATETTAFGLLKPDAFDDFWMNDDICPIMGDEDDGFNPMEEQMKCFVPDLEIESSENMAQQIELTLTKDELEAEAPMIQDAIQVAEPEPIISMDIEILPSGDDDMKTLEPTETQVLEASTTSMSEKDSGAHIAPDVIEEPSLKEERVVEPNSESNIEKEQAPDVGLVDAGVKVEDIKDIPPVAQRSGKSAGKKKKQKGADQRPQKKSVPQATSESKPTEPLTQNQITSVELEQDPSKSSLLQSSISFVSEIMEVVENMQPEETVEYLAEQSRKSRDKSVETEGQSNDVAPVSEETRTQLDEPISSAAITEPKSDAMPEMPKETIQTAVDEILTAEVLSSETQETEPIQQQPEIQKITAVESVESSKSEDTPILEFTVEKDEISAPISISAEPIPELDVAIMESKSDKPAIEKETQGSSPAQGQSLEKATAEQTETCADATTSSESSTVQNITDVESSKTIKAIEEELSPIIEESITKKEIVESVPETHADLKTPGDDKPQEPIRDINDQQQPTSVTIEVTPATPLDELAVETAIAHMPVDPKIVSSGTEEKSQYGLKTDDVFGDAWMDDNICPFDDDFDNEPAICTTPEPETPVTSDTSEWPHEEIAEMKGIHDAIKEETAEPRPTMSPSFKPLFNLNTDDVFGSVWMDEETFVMDFSDDLEHEAPVPLASPIPTYASIAKHVQVTVETQPIPTSEESPLLTSEPEQKNVTSLPISTAEVGVETAKYETSECPAASITIDSVPPTSAPPQAEEKPGHEEKHVHFLPNEESANKAPTADKEGKGKKRRRKPAKSKAAEEVEQKSSLDSQISLDEPSSTSDDKTETDPESIDDGFTVVQNRRTKSKTKRLDKDEEDDKDEVHDPEKEEAQGEEESRPADLPVIVAPPLALPESPESPEKCREEMESIPTVPIPGECKIETTSLPETAEAVPVSTPQPQPKDELVDESWMTIADYSEPTLTLAAQDMEIMLADELDSSEVNAKEIQQPLPKKDELEVLQQDATLIPDEDAIDVDETHLPPINDLYNNEEESPQIQEKGQIQTMDNEPPRMPEEKPPDTQEAQSPQTLEKDPPQMFEEELPHMLQGEPLQMVEEDAGKKASEEPAFTSPAEEKESDTVPSTTVLLSEPAPAMDAEQASQSQETVTQATPIQPEMLDAACSKIISQLEFQEAESRWQTYISQHRHMQHKPEETTQEIGGPKGITKPLENITEAIKLENESKSARVVIAVDSPISPQEIEIAQPVTVPREEISKPAKLSESPAPPTPASSPKRKKCSERIIEGLEEARLAEYLAYQEAERTYYEYLSRHRPQEEAVIPTVTADVEKRQKKGAKAKKEQAAKESRLPADNETKIETPIPLLGAVQEVSKMVENLASEITAVTTPVATCELEKSESVEQQGPQIIPDSVITEQPVEQHERQAIPDNVLKEEQTVDPKVVEQKNEHEEPQNKHVNLEPENVEQVIAQTEQNVPDKENLEVQTLVQTGNEQIVGPVEILTLSETVHLDQQALEPENLEQNIAQVQEQSVPEIAGLEQLALETENLEESVAQTEPQNVPEAVILKEEISEPANVEQKEEIQTASDPVKLEQQVVEPSQLHDTQQDPLLHQMVTFNEAERLWRETLDRQRQPDTEENQKESSDPKPGPGSGDSQGPPPSSDGGSGGGMRRSKPPVTELLLDGLSNISCNWIDWSTYLSPEVHLPEKLKFPTSAEPKSAPPNFSEPSFFTDDQSKPDSNLTDIVVNPESAVEISSPKEVGQVEEKSDDTDSSDLKQIKVMCILRCKNHRIINSMKCEVGFLVWEMGL